MTESADSAFTDIHPITELAREFEPAPDNATPGAT
jgi:hypothetical protein